MKECEYCKKMIPEKYDRDYCPHCFAEFHAEIPYTAMNQESDEFKTKKTRGKTTNGW